MEEFNLFVLIVGVTLNIGSFFIGYSEIKTGGLPVTSKIALLSGDFLLLELCFWVKFYDAFASVYVIFMVVSNIGYVFYVGYLSHKYYKV